MKQLDLFRDIDKPNYRVWINGRYSYPADTKEEVEDIINDSPVGSLYSVESPVGLDVSEFIPF